MLAAEILNLETYDVLNFLETNQKYHTEFKKKQRLAELWTNRSGYFWKYILRPNLKSLNRVNIVFKLKFESVSKFSIRTGC